MGAVLTLVPTSNDETIRALESLLELARRGEIVGIAGCYRTRSGGEKAAFTGLYRANPYKAAAAAMRISMALANLQGEYDISP